MADLENRSSTRRLRLWLIYTAMIAVVIAAYLVIRCFGNTMVAPLPTVASHAHGGSATPAPILHVLIALMLVIAMARGLGNLFRLASQPPVVGEIIAGIMLGPSLLGRFWPVGSAFLIPSAVGTYLNVISQVGVILYMFLVGLELDPSLLRKRGDAAVAISHASIITPFLFGAILALVLYPKLSSSDVSFTSFSLFMGVSMSVTAFPVLARILTDRQIHKTRMGVIALTCAAVDDVTAWCLLAFVVSVVTARTAGAITTIGLALGFIALMIFVVRPAMVRLSLIYGNRGRLTQGVMASVFVALLLSACATEVIGIHAIFGAFALGAVIPHDSGMASDLVDRLEDIVVVLLLPAFFAFTGLRTQIGLVSGPEQWTFCILIILVASIGKFGGSAVAARLTGLNWRDASALGVLMNTRGLMELIVLNIGLELGVISPTLFAMLVLMALVTTLATTPILDLLARKGMVDEEVVREGQVEHAPAALAARPEVHVISELGPVLVPISNPAGAGALIDLALGATPDDAPPPHILALVRIPRGGVRSGLREIEQRVTPRSPALSVALEFAWSRNTIITPQAIWTHNPAADIARAVTRSRAHWLLLGSHRSVFGHDFEGGMVHEILERVRPLPVHVGVVIRGGNEPLERVSALVDSSIHGRATLELASRVARQRGCNLHALLMPARPAGEPDAELLGLVRDAGQSLGKRLHSDVLANASATQLSRQAIGSLVIVGSNLADRIGLSPEEFADGRRTVVVVHGSAEAMAARESHSQRFTVVKS